MTHYLVWMESNVVCESERKSGVHDVRLCVCLCWRQKARSYISKYSCFASRATAAVSQSVCSASVEMLSIEPRAIRLRTQPMQHILVK
jgi:hypothetical protein